MATTDYEFYQQCAIAAMQGVQEMGGVAGEAIEILPPVLLSKKAFDIADAMLDEWHKRKVKHFKNNIFPQQLND